MSNRDNQLYEFGEFRLDAAARLLTRQGQTITLTPKALELLLVLAAKPGEVLDKETLLQAVWPDSFVEENNLADNVFKLRRALGEGFIETVPKRGYRFIAPVRLTDKTAPLDPAPIATTPRRYPWILFLAVAAAALGIGYIGGSRRPSVPGSPTALHTSILPPQNASFGHIALSPDGSWLAFTAATDHRTQLWLRSMANGQVKAVEGTAGASHPFWSPDGRSIAFFAGGRLKRVDLAGGLPANLCDAPATGTGGTWNSDGTILYTFLGDTRLWRVASSGGQQPVEVLRTASGQTDVSEPYFLPDGKHFLYLILSGDRGTRGLYVASLQDTRGKRLLEHDSNAVFVPGEAANVSQGHLLYGREGALIAQPFDASGLRLIGEARRLAERLGTAPGSNLSYRRRTFTTSNRGLLVFDPNPDRQRSQLVWVDRQGKQLQLLSQLDDVSVPMLSPDESRIVVARKDLATNNNDLWLAAAKDGGSLVRFTFDAASDLLGVWSPAGNRVIWSSARKGVFDLYQKSASGEGHDAPLLESSLSKFPMDWSPDGRYLLFRQIDPQTRHDIYVLPLSGEDRKPLPYLQTAAMESGASFSPDGRWVAYNSDETGRFEIYLESFPSHSGRRQISTSGGTAPRWSSDGRELFYYATDSRLMSVPITNQAAMTTGTPAALFSFRAVGTPTIASYAPSRDGRRFLLSAILDSDPQAPLSVLQNWGR